MDRENTQRLDRIKQLLLEARLLLDELDDSPTPPPRDPANVVPIRPDEVEVEGVIGRPELKEVKGRQLFTAGLKVMEGNVTRWHSIVAWGSTARSAVLVQRGDRVRVVGRFKENRYLDASGVMQVSRQLVCSLISPVIAASSAAK